MNTHTESILSVIRELESFNNALRDIGAEFEYLDKLTTDLSNTLLSMMGFADDNTLSATEEELLDGKLSDGTELYSRDAAFNILWERDIADEVIIAELKKLLES